MIIYRPHRGGLDAAMQEARFFDSKEEMINWLVEEHNASQDRWKISSEEIYIHEKQSDERVGWHDMYWIGFERYSKIKDKTGYRWYMGIRDEDIDDEDSIIDDYPIGVIGSFSTDFDFEVSKKWMVNC